MIIYNTNILAPLLLLVSAIDAFLLLCLARFMVSKFGPAHPGTIVRGLQQITDPLPQVVSRWLSTKQLRPIKPWTSWLIVIGGLLVLRYAIIALVVR